MRVPGMLHAALHLTDHARADIVGIDTAAAAAAARRARVLTAADIPGELLVGIIHKDWPVMIPVGGRTSYAGDVLAVVVADTREQARAAAAAGRRRATTCITPVTDPSPRSSPVRRSPCGAPTATCSAAATYARGDVDAALAASAHTVHEVFQTQRIEHAFLEPESTLAVPSGAGERSPPAGVLGRPGRVGRPRRHRPRARRADTDRGHRHAGVQRRRLRRQGGHEQPGARRARRLAARPPGEVHAVARGEPADAREAPPDPARVLGRVRRRRGADRRAGARHRRQRCRTRASA